MLKIEMDNGNGKIEMKGKKSVIMAEMLMAVHEFYNYFDDAGKRVFKAGFMDCVDEVFSDNVLGEDDINKACDKQAHDKKLDDLLECLDIAKSILKELGE